MNKTLQKILWKTRTLNQHLLVNQPLIWASKIHYVPLFALAVFTFNMLLAYLYPIGLTRVPNLDWVFGYCCFTGILLLCVWLYFQNLIDFRAWHSITTKYFDLKLILIIHLIVAIIYMVLFVPFVYFSSRFKEAYTDKNIPVLYSTETGGLLRQQIMAQNAMMSHTQAVAMIQSKVFDQNTPYVVDSTYSDSARITEKINKYLNYGDSVLSDLELAWYCATQVLGYLNPQIISIDSSTASINFRYSILSDKEDTVESKKAYATVFYQKFPDTRVITSFSRDSIRISKLLLDYTTENKNDTTILLFGTWKPLSNSYMYLTAPTIHSFLLQQAVESAISKERTRPEAEISEEVRKKLALIDKGLFIENKAAYLTISGGFVLLSYILMLILYLTRLFGTRTFIISLCLSSILITVLIFFASAGTFSTAEEGVNPFGVFLLMLLLISIMTLKKLGNIGVKTLFQTVLLQVLVFSVPVLCSLSAFCLPFVINENMDKITITILLLFLPVLIPWFILIQVYRFFARPRE